MLRTSSLKFWLKGVLIFPLLSGLLMLLGWPPTGIFPALFAGLVPLFFAFDEIEKIGGKGKYPAAFLASFVAHFLWVGYSLRWLGTTSPQSYLTGVTFESLSLSLALLPVCGIGVKYGKNVRFVFFASAWLCVEFLNQNWLLGTPYLALGSGFGMFPKVIQHYEFIGVEGGTLWLLVSNFFVYKVIVRIREKAKARSIRNAAVIGLAVIFVPVLCSILLNSAELTGEKIKISVLHIDREADTKEFGLYPEKMTNALFALTEPALKEQSSLVVWPEVVVVNLGWLMNISQEKAFLSVYKKLEQYQGSTICTGGYGYSVTNEGEGNPYASYDSVYKYYYLTHNIALSITYGERSPIRSKEDFVPFQERIPLLKEMPFMASFADIVGSNAKISYFPNGVEVHKTKQGTLYTPVLCYESVFPLKMAQRAKDVELITISANESWNRDLSGSKQYLYNNVGMAIQSRIPIAKSSNSGVSAIIDAKGNILGERKGNDEGLITKEINICAGPTFYSMISGFFYWSGTIVFISLLCWFLFSGLKPISNKKI